MSSNDSAAAAGMDRLLGYLGQNPENLRLRADIFGRALAAGLHDEAQRQVDWVLRRHPVDFGWRHRGVLLDMALGRLDSAALVLQSLVDEGQTDPVLAVNLAHVDFLQGRFQAAAARLRTLQARGPLPGTGLALLLRCLHHQGELTAAIGLFQDSLPASPSPDAFAAASLVAIDAGLLPEAQSWATQALAADPGSQEALVALGTTALGRQDAAQALRYLLPARDRRPEDGRTWSALGLAHLLAHDLDAARDALARAVAFMPGHIGTWHCLGWCEIFRGDLPAAKAAFEASVALDRNFGESHGGVAAVLALQGEREAAEAGLRRARRLSPNSLSAQYAQSVLNGDTADFERFRQAAQAAFAAHRAPDGDLLSSALFGRKTPATPPGRAQA